MRSEFRLIIDIGNSYIKLAVLNDADIVHSHSAVSFDFSSIEKLINKYGIKSGIYASVRSKQPSFIQQTTEIIHLIAMRYDLPIPITNKYVTPETLGMDRLASVIGAHSLFPDTHSLVIDMGTCIKYDFVDKDGCYWGGNIAPGLQMRLESMHSMTSKLPLVEKAFNADNLGKSTEEALQNGAVWGIKLEVERFIKILTDEWGQITIILSGGDSKYFGEIIESKIFVLPELVLKGLDETLKFNLLE